MPLREYFPAALEAFDDLAAPDTLQLLAKAPDPVSAARLTTGQITAALTRARRRGVPAKAAAIAVALRGEQMHQPLPVTNAYVATVRSQTVIIAALNGEIAKMEQQVTARFRGHPDAAIYLSQPASATSSARGSWVSSVMTRIATPALRRARTTPPPARSLASPAA